MGCCSEEPKKSKKGKYKCEICGAASDVPRDCCGQPMKKQK